MEDAWMFFKNEVMPHWPFLGGWLLFVFAGQFMKVQVWTKENARTSKFFHFMRRTLGIHPAVTGFGLGFVPMIPVSPGIGSLAGRVLYWSVCGIVASWGFNIAKQWVKKKYDIDLGDAVAQAVSPSMPPAASDSADDRDTPTSAPPDMG